MNSVGLNYFDGSQLQELGASMLELWALMDTPLEDQKRFEHVTCNIAATEDEVVTPGALARDIIEQVLL